MLLNPCSEYMHRQQRLQFGLTESLRFLQADGSFNVDLFKKAVDTLITAQEIIVGNSSYPTER